MKSNHKPLIIVAVSCIALLQLGCKPPTKPGGTDPQDEVVETERVKAEAGVGKRGQAIGNKNGILRTPAKALFKVEQEASFLLVKKALQLYQAQHDRLPKNHDEFMQEIVVFNKIELPELPEGHTYIWDAEKGELQVERPKKK